MPSPNVGSVRSSQPGLRILRLRETNTFLTSYSKYIHNLGQPHRTSCRKSEAERNPAYGSPRGPPKTLLTPNFVQIQDLNSEM